MIINLRRGMYNVIASSFFHKKICVLPGLGTLKLVTHAAETDFSNTQIKSPRQEIIFSTKEVNTGVFNEFSAISQLMKQKIADEGQLYLAGIGTFKRAGTSSIQFYPVGVSSDLLQPVTAARVIHKDAPHSMLVGDKETNNVAMAELLNEEVEAAPYKWWIGALVLAAAGLAAIGFYFFQHGFFGLANVQ